MRTPNSKRTAIRQAIRRFVVGEDGTSGAALVEFTILAPMVVVASIYTMDFGLLFFNKMEVQDAAQAGVQWAITNRVYNPTDVQTAAQKATNITITLAKCPQYKSSSSIQFCGCPDPTAGVNWDSDGACPGGTTCSDGSTKGTYICVSVTPTTKYTSMIPFGLIAKTYSLTAQSTARIQ